MSQLPGIGKRTALRLVLFLLNQPNSQTIKLSKSLVDLIEGIIFMVCNAILKKVIDLGY